MNTAKLKLYSYFRSSASFRVRIALNLKKIDYEIIPIHLLKNGGMQHSPEYRSVNPSGTVPALLTLNNEIITQSVAIIDYLDSVYADLPLFPKNKLERAHVLEFCELINSGIQPLQNLKVTQYLNNNFGLDKAKCDGWTKHWITDGLTAAEKWLEKSSGKFCFGDTITAADCFLIPQVFAMKRFNVPLENFPQIQKIDTNCSQLDAFKKAHPQNQIDFEV